MNGSFSEIAEHCVKAAGHVGDTSTQSMKDVLVAAIWHDRIGDLVSAYQDEPDLAFTDAERVDMEAALTAVTQINRDVDAHFMQVREALANMGVDCERIENGKPYQYHAYEVRIRRRDLHNACKTLGNMHFPLAKALSGGAIAAIGATQEKLELMHDAVHDMRVTFRWNDDGLAGRLPRWVKPTFADFQLVRLPAKVWPLYLAIHPFRAAFERLIGPIKKDDLVFSQASLGTPQSLILPLLQKAQVTPDDKLVDFGCGDGRVIALALKEYGCTVFGLESNATLAAIANEKVRPGPNGQPRIEHREGLAKDVTGATVVFLFLPMVLAARLIPNLIARMAPGGRLVMHEQSALPADLKPDASLPVFSQNAMTVAHFWKV